MGLLDAPEYDPAPAERRWRMIIAAVVIVIVAVAVWFFYLRYWSEKRTVDHFFQAIERKDFETAYGIYQGDSKWKEHPDQRLIKAYSVNQFILDWGPQGEYGPITSHSVDCAIELPKKDFHSASGVIVVVTINNRPVTKSLWVEKDTGTIGISPNEARCQ